MRRITPALILLAVALPAAALAAAPSPEEVEKARQTRDRAARRVKGLTEEVRGLTVQYQILGSKADQAAAMLVDAYRAELEMEGALAGARSILNRRANAAYRSGPGAIIEVFLDSASPADFLASQELLERTIHADIEEAARVLEGQEEAARLRIQVERQRAGVLARYRQLQGLREQIEARLEEAEGAARRAGLRFFEVRQARQRFLEEQAALADAIGAVGVDQSKLLALLGPSKGRGCTIPPKLADTGNGFSGTASWYGWEFAGRRTSSGAIFDPRLFTAAHKTLPLNSFIRVRWNGRCATLLVNDRGPFHSDWVLDLSQAAAEYLGYDRAGTAQVQADILRRR
jgi:hypothetical protein